MSAPVRYPISFKSWFVGRPFVPRRLIKTSDPRVVIWTDNRGAHHASASGAPDEDGWDLLRRLPAIVREAVADDEARRVRVRRLRHAYRRGWR